MLAARLVHLSIILLVLNDWKLSSVSV